MIKLRTERAAARGFAAASSDRSLWALSAKPNVPLAALAYVSSAGKSLRITVGAPPVVVVPPFPPQHPPVAPRRRHP